MNDNEDRSKAAAEALTHGAPYLENQVKDKFWSGDPDQCDICRKALVKDFYDAKTFDGPWATMCEVCWKDCTRQQLGTGLGQHYQRVWKKVAG